MIRTMTFKTLHPVIVVAIIALTVVALPAAAGSAGTMGFVQIGNNAGGSDSHVTFTMTFKDGDVQWSTDNGFWHTTPVPAADDNFWRPTPIPGDNHWQPTPIPVPPAKPRVEKWTSLFSLDRGTTYTYALTAFQSGRERAKGELSIRRVGQQVEFEVRFGRNTEQATSDYDLEALAGQIAFMTMTSLTPFTDTELKLAMLPLRFARWHDEFAQGDFAKSTVWQTRGKDALRFVASPSWVSDTVYEGDVIHNHNSILSLQIDLRMPLPTRARWTEGAWEYRAELVSPRPTSRPRW